MPRKLCAGPIETSILNCDGLTSLYSHNHLNHNIIATNPDGHFNAYTVITTWVNYVSDVTDIPKFNKILLNCEILC